MHTYFSFGNLNERFHLTDYSVGLRTLFKTDIKEIVCVDVGLFHSAECMDRLRNFATTAMTVRVL
jgi:hypothetical protein